MYRLDSWCHVLVTSFLVCTTPELIEASRQPLKINQTSTHRKQQNEEDSRAGAVKGKPRLASFQDAKSDSLIFSSAVATGTDSAGFCSGAPTFPALTSCVTPFFLERNPVFETTLSRPNAATVHRQADARFRVNPLGGFISSEGWTLHASPRGPGGQNSMQSRDREAVADNALDTSGVNSQRCVSALSFPGSTVEYIFAPKAQTCAGSRSLLYVLF